MECVEPGDRLRLIWNIPPKNYRGQPAQSEDGYACFARIRPGDNNLESVAMPNNVPLQIFCACHPTHGRFAFYEIRYAMVSGHPSYGVLQFPGENVEFPIEKYREEHSAVVARVLER